MAAQGRAGRHHHSTVGQHRLRLRNLPFADADTAPDSASTLSTIIFEHTGVHTFHALTWHSWTTRRREFAWAFINVNSKTDGAHLLRTIHTIVNNDVPWEAEWTHDSAPALAAAAFARTNTHKTLLHISAIYTLHKLHIPARTAPVPPSSKQEPLPIPPPSPLRA